MYQGAAARPLFLGRRFVVEPKSIGYIPPMVLRAQQIVLADHARLPWRFFGRLTAVQAGRLPSGPTPHFSKSFPRFFLAKTTDHSNPAAPPKKLARPPCCRTTPSSVSYL